MLIVSLQRGTGIRSFILANFNELAVDEQGQLVKLFLISQLSTRKAIAAAMM
jgi:hypothetical protein